MKVRENLKMRIASLCYNFSTEINKFIRKREKLFLLYIVSHLFLSCNKNSNYTSKIIRLKPADLI